MQDTEFEVAVQKDHLKKLSGSKPIAAIAELIWNSLDADASSVKVSFKKDLMDGLSEIHIQDDGDGIPYKDAISLFSPLGGSWKAQAAQTRRIGRTLHGQEGQGRFKAFALGRIAEWHVRYKKNDQIMTYLIRGMANMPNKFTLTAEKPCEDSTTTGVTLIISEPLKNFKSLSDDDVTSSFAPYFVKYLLDYKNVGISIQGESISTSKYIKNQSKYEIGKIVDDDTEYQCKLEIIEWNDIQSSDLFLCSENGFPLSMYEKQIRGIGDYQYSAFISSGYITKLNNHGLLSLLDMERSLSNIIDSAKDQLKNHFKERMLEDSADQIKKWKEEKVYPYHDEPTGPVETAERQVFDIMALNLHKHMPTLNTSEQKLKKFQFLMLRQVIEKSPDDLQAILHEVIQLGEAQRAELFSLLKETSLSAMISASRKVADRLKFLDGLEQIIFTKEMKKNLKERSQLHRILADNTWVFGDMYDMSVDDKSLTEVLRAHIRAMSHKDEVVIDEPVKRIDGKTGIVDLMLTQSIPRNHHSELEHLVIELKAPTVTIAQKELNQLESYAFAVSADERFRGLNTRWDFWIVSNDMDAYAQQKMQQPGYSDGVFYRSNTNSGIDITLRIKTWSQIIQECRHRLEFIKKQLNLNIDRSDGLKYLKDTYASYTQGVIEEEHIQASS